MGRSTLGAGLGVVSVLATGESEGNLDVVAGVTLAGEVSHSGVVCGALW
jgi:hypothetical protein